MNGGDFMVPASSSDAAMQIQLDIQRRMLDQMGQMNTKLTDIGERVVRMEERDKRIDENRIAIGENKRVTLTKIEALDARLSDLEDTRTRQEGAVGFIKGVKDWSGVIAAVMSALGAAWLYGRSLGITPPPRAASAQVEAVIQPDDRTIQGTIGKPR